MAIVRIPTPLRRLTQGEAEVKADGATVAELIEDLEKNYEGLKTRICDDSGAVRRFVNIYVNDEDIRFLENVETALKEDDIVSIIPAIAGGNALEASDELHR